MDYYPEHWPRERWETDVALMQEMGIQVVRMGEFSWHKMEPREGEYDFAWLDEAVSLLGRYGISVILGTPTAAPPAWLVNKYPEILPWTGRAEEGALAAGIMTASPTPSTAGMWRPL